MTNIDRQPHTQTNTQGENIITSLSRVIITSFNKFQWLFILSLRSQFYWGRSGGGEGEERWCNLFAFEYCYIYIYIYIYVAGVASEKESKKIRTNFKDCSVGWYELKPTMMKTMKQSNKRPKCAKLGGTFEAPSHFSGIWWRKYIIKRSWKMFSSWSVSLTSWYPCGECFSLFLLLFIHVLWYMNMLFLCDTLDGWWLVGVCRMLWFNIN